MPQASPHDTLFKEIFSKPEHARVELTAVLPEMVTRHIDWSTLRVEPGSFVDLADADRHADLLFSVQVSGQDAFIYVLFEHQSSTDSFMPLRLLGYMLRLWEPALRVVPRPKFLTPILPVVLHHSESGWTAPTSFHDLFESEILRATHLHEFIPSFRFALDDLSHKTDAELLARAAHESERVVPLVLWALRDARNHERLTTSLLTWANGMALALRAPTGAAALQAVLRYISLVTEFLTPSAILAVVERAAPETKDLVMTLAEQWKQEGRAEGVERGRAEGVERGRAEGIEKGERAILVKLMTLKFGPLSETSLARINSATPVELELWAERILTATLLENVLA